MHPEDQRLSDNDARRAHWERWGPYLSERAWGTVREDYSPDGSAWDFFPHEHARSRVFRWSEDGILGWCDNHQRLCFGITLWNGQDRILKERLFGLSGNEGNHGEDVKEIYYHQDALPSGAYARGTYRYPHRAFPYDDLVALNRSLTRAEPELEVADLGLYDSGYFDVQVEYAKPNPEDVYVRITVVNHGPAAKLHLLPTAWFRNTWAFDPLSRPPALTGSIHGSGEPVIKVAHETLGERWLIADAGELLFTDNETNNRRLWGAPNTARYLKDAFHDRVVGGDPDAVNPILRGTKAAVWQVLDLAAGETRVVRLMLIESGVPTGPFDERFDRLVDTRRAECATFYQRLVHRSLGDDAASIQRQAFAGLVWSRQYYHYSVSQWLDGDRGQPPPPESRRHGRNAAWTSLHNEDVILMPDKWEYPWYAAWDLAFHCIAYSLIDPGFAKRQLILFLREWYMHPNGQIPAYEWALGDVNPPVHAYAVWRVYKIDKRLRGVADVNFLERAFHKLLLNFTWWVNRKDAQGRNVFEGGFLGLDNIGVFERSSVLPGGAQLEQSDATAWMGMFCLNMMAIAIELAYVNPAYEDVASKFFEHFVYISDAMNRLGENDSELWDEADGFYYDMLRMPDGRRLPLRVRSLVGLTPLFAVETIEPRTLERLPGFYRRMMWFIRNRPALRHNIDRTKLPDGTERRMLSLVPRSRLARLLSSMLDEKEFLSPYGIRSVSRVHAEKPYVIEIGGTRHAIGYEPGESVTGVFGGNSNWRGPVWFPMNYLLIESLQRFHYYLGSEFTVECPTGSGTQGSLWTVATELSRRMIHLFEKDGSGQRPAMGPLNRYADRAEWRDNLLFHEYFHGETGAGLGASHQTGWTALVAKMILQSGA